MTAVLLQTATTPAAHACLARLAHDIWHEHYAGIISHAQIEYMLAEGYSAAALAAQQTAGTRLVLAYRGDLPAAFAALSPDRAAAKVAWVDKLYVHADVRGLGIARALLADLRCHAHLWGARQLRLRVNRHNAEAIAAYERMGFAVERTHIKDIGHGFVMDDYLMAQALTN